MKISKKNVGLYKSKDLIGSFLSSRRNSEVLKFVKGSLVDLACGDNELVRLYGSGIGFDIESYGNDKVVVVADYETLPLGDKSTDTFTIVASLNYFDNPLEVLQEVNRKLKDNGILVITMPNFIAMKIWHIFREPWAQRSGFREKDLINLLNSANFILSEANYFLFGLNRVYKFTKNA